MYYLRNPEVIYRRNGYSGIVADPKTTACRFLNATGARTFECCDGLTVEEIARILSEEFNASYSSSLEEVKKALLKMERYRLIKRIKKRINPKEILHKKFSAFKKEDKDEVTMPIVIEMKITNACNLKCIHCCANSGVPEKNEMTTKDVKKLIDDAKEAGIFLIGFTGGEPMIRNDFLEIARYGYEKGFILSLVTNGHFINKKNAPLLKKYLKAISISIDGSTPDIHDKIRATKGSWKIATNAVKILSRIGANVGISTIATPQTTKKEIKKRIEMAIKLKAKYLAFGAINSIGRCLEHPELIFTKEKFISIFSDFLKVASNYRDKISINFDEFSRAFSKEFSGGCGIAKYRYGIMPTGDVVPCAAVDWKPPFIGGNIRDKSFKEIILSSKSFEELRNIDVDKVELCRNCKHRYACGAGCRAVAYMNTGSIFGKPPMCPFMP